MKVFLFALILFVAAAGSVYTQSATKPLATAEGVVVNPSDLSESGRSLFNGLTETLAAGRTRILATYLADILLEMEAKAKNIPVAQLQDQAIKTVPNPTDAAVQAIYDSNRAALGNKPLTEVKAQIVEFLRQEPEQNALQAQVADLQKKYALKIGKDVNAAGLKPMEVLATIGSRTVTAQEFEEKNKIELADASSHVYEELRYEVEETLLSALVIKEAKALSIEPNEFLAREITNKMRDFTDEEAAELKYALQKRLYSKYSAKITIDEPTPLVLNVSADDDPATGPENAPVTIVMFSDFQCPACARTHPVLNRVVNEYPGKVRLVVRDFPLENMHPEAFLAATAANAARAQGKYTEFVELLYRNQESLKAESLQKFAAELGLDTKKMIADMAAPANAAEIRKDISDGSLLGINGTPTIFVNGIKVHTLSPPAFRRAIERALSK